MTKLFTAFRYAFLEEMDRKKREAKSQIELNGRMMVNALQKRVLKQTRIIVLEESAIAMILDKMDNDTLPVAARYPEPPTQPLWIEFAQPLSALELPYGIDALMIGSYTEAVIEDMLQSIPQRLREAAGTTARRQLGLWGADVIVGLTNNFSFQYIAQQRAWQNIIATFICSREDPKCNKDNLCDTCRLLPSHLGAIIGATLLAETGYFQQVRFIDDSYSDTKRVTVPGKHGKTKTTNQHITTAIRRVVIDASIVEMVQPAPELEHDKEEQGQHEKRADWATLHDASEIAIETKSTRAHMRHLRSGKVVPVKQSKPRVYRKLKESSPAETTLMAKLYEES